LQVIAMTLDEVSSKTIEASNFVYLSAAKTTQKAVEEYSYETEGERNKVSVLVLQDFTFKANETIYHFCAV
jgi:two-component system CAI-1 autoinducer sensor kinase/phosphatase CqsS